MEAREMGEDERVPEDMPQHKRQRTGSDEEGHGADKSVPQTPGHKEHTAADSSEVGEGSGSAAKGDLEKAQGQPLDAPEDPTQDAQKDEDKQDKAPDAADDAPFLPMPGVGGSAENSVPPGQQSAVPQQAFHPQVPPHVYHVMYPGQPPMYGYLPPPPMAYDPETGKMWYPRGAAAAASPWRRKSEAGGRGGRGRGRGRGKGAGAERAQMSDVMGEGGEKKEGGLTDAMRPPLSPMYYQAPQEMMEAMTVVELLNRSVDMMAEAVSRGATPADLQASLARKSLKETARNHAEESWRKLEGTKQVEDFRCLWRRVEGAYKSKEKSNDQLVSLLKDNPTVIAAALDSERGRSLKQAAVQEAVFAARPMLNLLVGVLSKHVSLAAWNNEVRPVCEELKNIFGKPGLFCGHATGQKEFKEAELLRVQVSQGTVRPPVVPPVLSGKKADATAGGILSLYGKPRSTLGCRCETKHCLKLFCTCFRNDMRCTSSCSCLDCCNDGKHEEQRAVAVAAYRKENEKKVHKGACKPSTAKQCAFLAAQNAQKEAGEKLKKEKERRKRLSYTHEQVRVARRFVQEYMDSFHLPQDEPVFDDFVAAAAGRMHVGGGPVGGGAGSCAGTVGGAPLGAGGVGNAGVDGTNSSGVGGRVGSRPYEHPKRGTFEHEGVWAKFCLLVGEVDERAINLWERAFKELREVRTSSDVVAGVAGVGGEAGEEVAPGDGKMSDAPADQPPPPPAPAIVRS